MDAKQIEITYFLDITTVSCRRAHSILGIFYARMIFTQSMFCLHEQLICYVGVYHFKITITLIVVHKKHNRIIMSIVWHVHGRFIHFGDVRSVALSDHFILYSALICRNFRLYGSKWHCEIPIAYCRRCYAHSVSVGEDKTVQNYLHVIQNFNILNSSNEH